MRSFVTVTEKQLEQAERLLSHVKGGASKAVARALNRSINTARSELVRGIREEYTVRAAPVRNSINIRSSTPQRLEAEIKTLGEPLPLNYFKVKPSTPNPRRTSKIRVSVRKGSAKPIGSAFVARLGGTNKVFERVGKARLPIRRLFGPSVPQMAENDKTIENVADSARVSMDKRLSHEIGRLIEKGGAK